MKDFFLVNYSVKGIKTLDQFVRLSFYKKMISNQIQTQEYNIKGIYGMNGSGKSGIVTSVSILRNLLLNSQYLNNPIVQKNLDAIINKKTSQLNIEVEYLFEMESGLERCRYELMLERDFSGKYVISFEQLSSGKANSKTETMDIMYRVNEGEISYIHAKNKDKFCDFLTQKTTNLLSNSTMCALFFEKILGLVDVESKLFNNKVFGELCTLIVFGSKLQVYLDQEDEHADYFITNALDPLDNWEKYGTEFEALVGNYYELRNERIDIIAVDENYVQKEKYEKFKNTIEGLQQFLKIFKTDLQCIEIEKKENRDMFICNLIMVYEDYKIHSEFESTGIKKLIRLYAYLREMVHGGIVFIDEFDSNLHDVYLCALLEYLMHYGEGQLCFTTHNVGPMDILKQNKKSIDFLSSDHQIYSWTTNGHYSPSKLYRNGMIEGSPFNVDAIDFIGVFGSDEEDE